MSVILLEVFLVLLRLDLQGVIFFVDFPELLLHLFEFLFQLQILVVQSLYFLDFDLV